MECCSAPDLLEIYAYASDVPVRTLCGSCGTRILPEPRVFEWAQATESDPKATVVLERPATWDDGGPFVVLETVAGGLEYAVVAVEGARTVQTVPLSLQAAIRAAEDYATAQRATVTPNGR